MTPKGKPGIIEPFCPPQIFVDDLCQIDAIGGMVHLIFASTRAEVHEPKSLSRVVEVRLIVSPDKIEAMAKAMLAGRVEPDRVTAVGDNVIPLH